MLRILFGNKKMASCFGMRGYWLMLVQIVVLAAVAGAVNVTWDHRALLLDGERRLLISGAIHYPRATPQMWPKLIADAKEGGVNVIQTYIFWSGHEPKKGQYNFAGRYDLAKFVRIVGEAGLYLNLRIGPYVCAEWNLGGFPTWLREVPGIEFRTDNEPFKQEMATFVTVIVDLMKEEKLFAWQGGPIILAQIENEYGNIEPDFGEKGQKYVKWAADFAESLHTGVPWIMCQQWDAPASIITTCNGYYCDGFKSSTPGAPTMWTEDWSGWLQYWGTVAPHRPVEDIAFAVARFYQRGGSFQNYYMYFGGTNFERTSGGPFIMTTYDYDAPLDEYGGIRQPKWGHLKELHEVLYHVEAALFASEAQYLTLGPNQEAHVYNTSSAQGIGAGRDLERGTCLAFLANIDNSANKVVEFNGQEYDLPAWSVSILPDCETVVFNTAKISAQTSVRRMKQEFGQSHPLGDHHIHLPKAFPSNSLQWESHREPVGPTAEDAFEAQSLLEQIITTRDLTDYLWYVTRFEVSVEDAKALSSGTGQARIVLHEVRDAVHIFVNGELVGSATGIWIHVDQTVTLNEGVNELALLSMTVGLTNYGSFLEKECAGIRGAVHVEGLPSGVLDLTSANWMHQVGLMGEKANFFTKEGAASVSWGSGNDLSTNKPLLWYKTTFMTPDGKDPVVVDLGTMGKGQLFVNGHHLGRYWPSLLSSQQGCSDTCDYRGVYNPGKCVTGCGQPSQRWHHIPREWLEESDENLLVLFEEMGGDPLEIAVATGLQDSVCGYVTDSHPPPLSKWIQSSKLKEHPQKKWVPEVRLECSNGHNISHIVFASYGNPSGMCGRFQQGSCHSSVSLTAVEKACKGRRLCTVQVSGDEFGHDPCPGAPKHLAVEALCRDPDEISSKNYIDANLATSQLKTRWQRDAGSKILDYHNRWQMGHSLDYGQVSFAAVE